MNYQAANQIQITRVSYGWIVFIPPKNPKHDFLQGLESVVDMAQKRQSVDPLLDDIRKRNEEREEKDAEEYEITRDENSFIFPSFVEVLSFLKLKIKE